MGYSTSTTIIYGRKLEPKDYNAFHDVSDINPLVSAWAGNCCGGETEIFVGVYAITLHEDNLSMAFSLPDPENFDVGRLDRFFEENGFEKGSIGWYWTVETS